MIYPMMIYNLTECSLFWKWVIQRHNRHSCTKIPVVFELSISDWFHPFIVSDNEKTNFRICFLFGCLLLIIFLSRIKGVQKKGDEGAILSLLLSQKRFVLVSLWKYVKKKKKITALWSKWDVQNLYNYKV